MGWLSQDYIQQKRTALGSQTGASKTGERSNLPLLRGGDEDPPPQADWNKRGLFYFSKLSLLSL